MVWMTDIFSCLGSELEPEPPLEPAAPEVAQPARRRAHSTANMRVVMGSPATGKRCALFTPLRHAQREPAGGAGVLLQTGGSPMQAVKTATPKSRARTTAADALAVRVTWGEHALA